MFGIVGTLVVADIIFLIPTTVVSSARLRREQQETEGDNVSILKIANLVITVFIFYRLMIYLQW